MMKFDLTQFDPCEDALIFYDNYDSFEDAWNACPRGDWMLWIAHKLKVDHRILTLAKSRCTRTVIHLMEDERSINAVDVAEQYGLGKASKEELSKAAKEAKNAYIGYPSHAAAAAFCAAAAAGYDSAGYDSAAAAGYDSAASSEAAAKSNNERQTADICRELLTELVFKQINETL